MKKYLVKILVLVSLLGFASVGVASATCVTVEKQRQGKDCGDKSVGMKIKNRCGVPVYAFVKFKKLDGGWGAEGREELKVDQTSRWLFHCEGTGGYEMRVQEQ